MKSFQMPVVVCILLSLSQVQASPKIKKSQPQKQHVSTKDVKILKTTEENPSKQAVKKEKKQFLKDKEEFVIYKDFEFFVKRTFNLPKEQSLLVSDIRSGNDYKLASTMQLAMIQKNLKGAALSQEEVLQVVRSLSGTISEDLKTSFDRVLQVQSYNKDYSNPIDLIQHKKLQCRSSALMLMMAEMNNPKTFQDREITPVAIFQPQHILIGYVQETSEGQKLFGIEGTVKGKAKKDFGFTSQLKGAIRVIPMDIFMISEILRDNIHRPDNFMKMAVNYGAEKFSIDLKQTESFIKKTNFKVADHQIQRVPDINDQTNSLFAFGEVNIPPGDQDMSTADELTVERENGEIIQYIPVPENQEVIGEVIAMPQGVSATNGQMICTLYKEYVDVLTNPAMIDRGRKAFRSLRRLYKERGLSKRQRIHLFMMFRRYQASHDPFGLEFSTGVGFNFNSMSDIMADYQIGADPFGQIYFEGLGSQVDLSNEVTIDETCKTVY